MGRSSSSFTLLHFSSVSPPLRKQIGGCRMKKTRPDQMAKKRKENFVSCILLPLLTGQIITFNLSDRTDRPVVTQWQQQARCHGSQEERECALSNHSLPPSAKHSQKSSQSRVPVMMMMRLRSSFNTFSKFKPTGAAAKKYAFFLFLPVESHSRKSECQKKCTVAEYLLDTVSKIMLVSIVN